MKQENWHKLTTEKAAQILKTDPQKGLKETEIKKRQKKFGLNRIAKEKPFSALKILLEQFKSPLIYILVLAGFITLLLKEYTDSAVIFGAVILNTIVGFFQENKASRALQELKKVVKYKARVIRNGNTRIIDSENLVPGDIFILAPGDKVPADGRIIQCHNLKTNEMALTGEWLPAKKTTKVLPEETPLADRDNMVYMGTVIEDGKARIITTATGFQTEIGKVAEIIRETREEKTPLQKKLSHFARIVGGIILAICLIIFIEGIITGNTFLEMFITAVAVAVAAIPEGLPVAMTVILALGMQRILKRKGLVRKLLAAETLGSTSIVATDKTATLTEGKMTVSEVFSPRKILRKLKDEKTNLLTLTIASLCSEAFVENHQEPLDKWIIRGGPTDKALLTAGIKAGINREKIKEKMSLLEELPFNPTNKFIANLYEQKQPKSEKILYISGAPEKILGASKFIEIKGRQEILFKKRLEKIEKKLEKLTEAGLRIIALGYKKIENNTQALQKEINNLVFTGFVALNDPLRKDVKKAIKVCRLAGMRPIIVTGDHKLTAKAIAKELGLKTKKENIIEGKDLDKLSDQEFQDMVKDIEVYARVEPSHKMRIIEAWQNRGQVVAMTGDGINDAPALKKADIGVAIGSGTDVAKEVADLILLPDSFNIIVAAVEEGRAILDNIRKVITYLFADGFTEVALIAVSLPFAPLPILAAQILWINLIEDGPAALSLAFEPKEKDLMNRKPEGRDIPLLTRGIKHLILIIALATNLLLLSLFFWLWKLSHDIVYVRTMIFAALTIDSLFYVFSCKSLRRNLWHINPFSNKYLVVAFLGGIVMLFLAIYFPVFQTLLRTIPLGFADWLILFGLGMVELILIELTKYYFIIKRQVI